MRIELLQPEHLDAAADVHLDAFRGYPNARLGRPYARAFLQWFRNSDRGAAFVAVDDDNQVAGYVAGALLPYGEQLNRDLFPLVAKTTLLRPWILLNGRFLRAVRAKILWTLGRRKQFISAEPELPQPTMSLVGIGTAARARGRGVGGQLVAAFEEEARRRGARSLRLSVYAENITARRLYERCGWTFAGGSDEPGSAVYYAKVLAPGQP